ncbi:MAG: hypothetical protein K6G22_15360, partial [Lachnospiraceae bacterium]|nr:hypothetical protein [Lachnospiraceae bacterium]
MMKKLMALLLAGAMACSLMACGDSAMVTGDIADTATTDNATTDTVTTDDAQPVSDAGATSINVCLASEPASIDPALNSAVDGATMLIHLFSGLAKWELKDDGTIGLVADAAVD